MHEKKINLPTEKEAETLTGLQAGGISPLALVNRGFQLINEDDSVYADGIEEIHVSCGQRELNICLPFYALMEITHAKVAQISD